MNLSAFPELTNSQVKVNLNKLSRTRWRSNFEMLDATQTDFAVHFPGLIEIRLTQKDKFQL
jgi:hypothetical protein